MDEVVIVAAEEHRGELDESFFLYRDYVEVSLTEGQWPDALEYHAVDACRTMRAADICDAALKELHILICTDDARYKDVRAQGDAFWKLSLPAVSGYVAASVGVAVGVATGAVAFISLVVLKLGVATFCRVATKASKAQLNSASS